MSTEEAGRGRTALVPLERIVQAILVIRGERVMLDEDLAELYEVETRILTRAVRRNAERFPPDFMFQLSGDEWDNLKSQIGISSRWGGRRSLPLAFTEHGVAMLSGVLRSPRAIQMNLEIMRAFVLQRRQLASHEELAVQLRHLLASHEELAARLDELAAETDARFRDVYEMLARFLASKVGEGRRIGFLTDKAAGDEE